MMLLHYPGKYRQFALEAIFDLILRERLGLDCQMVESVEAGYCLRGEGRQLVIADDFFARAVDQWMLPTTLPQLPLAQWDVSSSGLDARIVRDRIPVLYGKAGFQIDKYNNGHLSLDVFGSAYFMLSRYEEVVCKERDRHDRFPASASMAWRGEFLDRPIVDEYVEILRAAITRVWSGVRWKAQYPRMLVSHDVDAASQYGCRPLGTLVRSAAGDVLKRGSVRAALGRVRAWSRSRSALQPNDPFNTFDWIMDTSEKHGLRSAFYFICGRTDPHRDSHYEIEYPAIRALLRRIHERGHEIGLHPSYGTYRNPQTIVAEWRRLSRICNEEGIRQPTWGGRMHYLRWETPTTLYGWEAAGTDYDSTLGYADKPGFRCGTCHEYVAVDPIQGKALSLRIRPLIAMECTVIDEQYLGLGTGEAAYSAFAELKRACNTVRGTFTLLWHNTRLISVDERLLYEAVLAS